MRTLTKADWEDYMAVGRIPSHISPVVLESWKRSANRTNAEVLKQAPQVAPEALCARQNRASRLRKAARPALNRAGHLLQDTDSILLLANAEGLVTDSAGNRRTLSRGEENRLGTGGIWTEEMIGTNAIGTALELNRATQILHAEHYCEEIQRWSCAAAPISDPVTGETLGVIDISWPSTNVHENALVLSVSLAAQVEGELTRALIRQRAELIEKFHLKQMRRGSGPMMMLDRHGANVFATEGFVQFCHDDAALMELQMKVPEMIDRAPEDLSDLLPDGVVLEVVERDDEAIGLMLSAPKRKPRPSDATRPVEQIGQVGEVSAGICAQAAKLAQTDISLLIEGETGTGKSYLARAIHQSRGASAGPFEVVDCARLEVEQLREDISANRFGRADGTLCLSSPGAASSDVQKLLLALVEDVTARGVRIITRSTQSLHASAGAGLFRSDLYYRIAGARLEIPPLRDRVEEIEPLLRRMVVDQAAASRGRELRFTAAAMDVLKRHSWPGNLREMKNLLATLDALSLSGLIHDRDLPPEFHQGPVQAGDTLRDVEKAEILAAMESEGNNMSKVAKRLGIARSTLYLKLEAYGIARPKR